MEYNEMLKYSINKSSYYFFKSSPNSVGLKRQRNSFHWFLHQPVCPVETWDCYEKLHQLGSDQVSLHMANYGFYCIYEPHRDVGE